MEAKQENRGLTDSESLQQTLKILKSKAEGVKESVRNMLQHLANAPDWDAFISSLLLQKEE